MADILLTGAHGFVGRILGARLSEAGHQVIGLARRVGTGEDRTLIHDLAEPLEYDGRFDLIVHAAASLPWSGPGLDDYVRNNVLATANLARFARDRGVARIIHLSTIGVYGEFRDPVITEQSDRINPEAYGLTKFLAEEILNAEKNMACLHLRLPGLVGPGARGVWLAETAARFLKHEPVTIYAPEFETTNFVHVDDLARFVHLMAQTETMPRGPLVLACLKGAKIIDIARRLKECTGSRSEIIVGEAQRPPFRLKAARAARLGYQSMTPLEIVDQYGEEARSPRGA